MGSLIVAWWLATAPPNYSEMIELQSKVYYSPKMYKR